jgi:uncharacterized protein YkwD
MRCRALHYPLSLVSLSLLCLCSQLGSAQQPRSAAERFLFDAVNKERKTHGLQPLRWDPALADAATRHAEAMAQRGYISHQFPGEPGFAARATKAGARFMSIAENVAEAPEASEIHQLWMHSSAHRANILDQDMNAVGIGVSERKGAVFAVEDFSKAQ